MDNTSLEHVMGKHGVGQLNSNGEKLIEFCGINSFIIGGTHFRHKTIHKITWKSNDGITRNQINHIIINRKWAKSLLDVRIKRGADISSDHFLVVANIQISLKARKKSNTLFRRYNTALLDQPEVCNQLQLEIRDRFK
uniref:Endonuclease/exonuclease/phosphatase domain-containing protein n=1 Tax=Latimeria chalumnae TaxID=7897 RepID=H2ZSJ3_LATCH